MESIICVSRWIFWILVESYELLLIIILDFSNILSKTVIERLAEVDEYEVVKEVQVRAQIGYLLQLT